MSATLLLIFCCVSLLFLAVTVFILLRARNTIPDLCQPLSQFSHRSVSIIVPARNEARDIDACLKSLLGQQGVDLELLVVNDHSTDGTGAIIDAIARRDNRVKALHNPELKPGWFGKANAMQTAAAQARNDYLLFTDADVEHAPEVLWAAITEMEKGSYDFMTLVPRFEVRTFWENVDLPMIVSGLLLLTTKHLEDPDRPDAVGGGAFMLVRRTVFEAVGGFESIRAEMLDDVGLARLIKRNRFKVGIRKAVDRLHLEMFKTNREAFIAPTKNILIVGGRHPWLALPVPLLAAIQFWSPPIAVVCGLLHGDALLTAVGAGTYLLHYSSLYLARPVFDFQPLKLLAFPLVVLVIGTCTVRALYFYYVKGSVAWRGRVLKHSGR